LSVSLPCQRKVFDTLSSKAHLCQSSSLN